MTTGLYEAACERNKRAKEMLTEGRITEADLRDLGLGHVLKETGEPPIESGRHIPLPKQMR